MSTRSIVNKLYESKRLVEAVDFEFDDDGCLVTRLPRGTTTQDAEKLVQLCREYYDLDEDEVYIVHLSPSVHEIIFDGLEDSLNFYIKRTWDQMLGKLKEDASMYRDSALPKEDDSLQSIKGWMLPVATVLDNYGEDAWVQERGSTEELDIPCKMLGGDRSNVYMISDEDEGSGEVFRFYGSLKKTEGREEKIDGGYCILVDTEVGPFVYQNQYGLEILFKKF